MYSDHMDVGVRELKAKLSEYLAAAAAGEEVIVTDRGRPVARLVPFGSTSSVERGVADGWIEAPRRTRLDVTPRHRSNSSVLDILDEDRG
jgi:prevent-host-death family protein